MDDNKFTYNDTNRIEILETTMDTLKLDIDRHKHKIGNNRLLNRISNMKQKLEEKIVRLDKLNNGMNDQVEEYIVKLQEYDDKAREDPKTYILDTDYRSKLENDIYSLIIQTQNLLADKTELLYQINFLNEEIDVLRADNNEINLKIKEHENEMHNMNQRLIDTQETLLQLYSEVESLKQKRTNLWNSVWEFFY